MQVLMKTGSVIKVVSQRESSFSEITIRQHFSTVNNCHSSQMCHTGSVPSSHKMAVWTSQCHTTLQMVWKVWLKRKTLSLMRTLQEQESAHLLRSVIHHQLILLMTVAYQEPDELPVTKKSAMDGKEEVPFKPTLTSKDSIAETLTCAICQVS